jgi:hypothetical protein
MAETPGEGPVHALVILPSSSGNLPKLTLTINRMKTTLKAFLYFAAALLTVSLSALAADADDLAQLKALIAAQQRQIEQLRATLEAQGKRIDAAFVLPNTKRPLGEVASATPIIPSGSATPITLQKTEDPDKPSPLSVRLGTAYLTPLGFMDFYSVIRSNNAGGGIGNNFAGIPFNGDLNRGHLSETRFSMQNSRLGGRIDAKFGDYKLLTYFETDFLGAPPTNLVVNTNSNTLRSRLFWVDVRKDKWEVLGGQSWSLMTPGRNGISPLPADIFFSNDLDVNYQAGLVWGRVPGFRFTYHASNAITAAFALENPEQYIGGSAGNTLVTLPSALTGLAGTQLDNGATGNNAPNLHPDIIGKLAFEPKLGGKVMHIEAAGVLRTFKIYNTVAKQSDTQTGGGGAVNMNLQVTKGLRLIANTFYGSGNGRYIFGQAPDLIVNGAGKIKTVDSGSTVDGIEWQVNPKTLVYAYYGGIYIRKTQSVDPANNKLIGWGYAGAPNGQNRTIQEVSAGFNQTLWKNDNYGALNFMGQYAYLTRSPWYFISSAALPGSDAHSNQVFLNLRYTLPGKAPTLK